MFEKFGVKRRRWIDRGDVNWHQGGSMESASGVVKMVMFLCVVCGCNVVKLVSHWPQPYCERARRVSDDSRYLAAVLTADCPEKKFDVGHGVVTGDRMPVEQFSRRFGDVIRFASSELGAVSFVWLQIDGEDLEEGAEDELPDLIDDCSDCDGGESDEGEIAPRGPYVPVLSEKEVEEMFCVEKELCCVEPKRQWGKTVLERLQDIW